MKLSVFRLAPNEEIALELDLATSFLASGETVSSYSVTLETSGGSDISETNLSGDASEASGVITSPVVSGLADGSNYKLRFEFVVSGLTYEYWILIECRDV